MICTECGPRLLESRGPHSFAALDSPNGAPM